MNVGKNKIHPKYICDKCGYEIKSEMYSYSKKIFKKTNNKKDFDLCRSCEKKFKEWLKTKDIITTSEMINKFPKYEEKKINEM